MNKQTFILTAGSASLILAAGVAGAAAPGGGGFGQYSATAGTITGCITGATCSTLVSGAGFLQQQVTVTSGIGAGSTYYRTVILDSGATATNAAAVSALGFRNETFVGASSNSGDLASDGVVGLNGTPGLATAGAGQTVYCTVALPCAGGVTTGSGLLANSTLFGVSIPQNTTEALLARGQLAQTTTGGIADIKSGAADPTGIKILQTANFTADVDSSGNPNLEPSSASNSIPGEYTVAACTSTLACMDGSTTGFGVKSPAALQTNMEITFGFLSQGTASAQSDRSNYMELDEGRFAGTDPGTMTVRRASGVFVPTAGTLTTPGGDSIAYAAGDDIAVSWFQNRVLGGGPFGYPTTGTVVGASGSLNGVVESETFRDYTTGAMANSVNDQHVIFPSTNAASNPVGMNGTPATLFTPLMIQTGTLTSNLQWSAANWDPAFGNAPLSITRNGTNTALLGAFTSMSQAFP